MSWHSSTLLQTAKKAEFDDSRVFDNDHEVTGEYKKSFWRRVFYHVNPGEEALLAGELEHKCG